MSDQVPTYTVPCWRFSLWDVAGSVTAGVGGIFTVLGQASNLLAREFAAAANYSRRNYDLQAAHEQHQAAQREIDKNLREIVGEDLS